MHTNASDTAIGTDHSQRQNGEERTIGFASTTLTPEQRRYCTTRKEILAVVLLTRLFRSFLLRRKFTVRTDHHSLTWLMNFKHQEGQLAWWLEELSQYDIEIVHRPGKKHNIANSLSRESVDLCTGGHALGSLEALPGDGGVYF